MSKCPPAGIAEGWDLYLLKLVPKILQQTGYSSTSYTLVRVLTCRNNIKGIMGGLQFPTVTAGLEFKGIPLSEVQVLSSRLGCSERHQGLGDAARGMLWARKTLSLLPEWRERHANHAGMKTIFVVHGVRSRRTRETSGETSQAVI